MGAYERERHWLLVAVVKARLTRLCFCGRFAATMIDASTAAEATVLM